MKRVIAQARKELIQIFRDRLALLLALALPVALLALLGSAISLTVTDIPIVVQDLDASPASRRYIEAFRGSLSFRIVPWPAWRGPEAAIESNAARAALIIPEHFSWDLRRGRNAEVQFLVDASDANTANIIRGYAGLITRAFLESTGRGAAAPAVQLETRLWYNPGRRSDKFYGPGMFVLGLSIFPPLLATLAMAKEGEQKTIVQVYVSSISAHEFLLGKIAAYMTIAAAQWLLTFLVCLGLFDLRITGDPAPFLIASFLYLFCVVSFGTLVGSAIPHQAAAIQVVALGGFLSSFLLSGLIFPIDNIPAELRWISNIVWARYYIEIVRDAFLKGGSWPAVWSSVLMIAVIGLVFYGLAWRRMRRMQVSA